MRSHTKGDFDDKYYKKKNITNLPNSYNFFRSIIYLFSLKINYFFLNLDQRDYWWEQIAEFKLKGMGNACITGYSSWVITLLNIEQKLM